MACCISSVLCDPVSGTPVIIGTDLESGVTQYFNNDGTAYTGDAAALVACAPDETVLLVTTNGTVLGVTQSGDADHTVDIVVVSADVGNDVTIGADGGAYLNVCDTVGLLPASGDTPNDAGAVGELLLGIDENGDCVLFDPPQGCCVISEKLCDPVTGAPVIVAIDLNGGPTQYFTGEGTAWAGTPADLVDCGGFVDCAGDTVAPGSKLLTVSDVIDSGHGLYFPFVPDPADPSGCRPAPRTSCLDVPAFTINDENKQYSSAAGQAGWVDDYFAQDIVSNPSGPNNFTPPAFTLAAGTAIGEYVIPGSLFCHEITNETDCRKQTCLVNQGFGYWQANVHSSWMFAIYGTQENFVNGVSGGSFACDETWTQFKFEPSGNYSYNLGMCYSRNVLLPGDVVEHCTEIKIRVFWSGTEDVEFIFGTVGGNGFCWLS